MQEFTKEAKKTALRIGIEALENRLENDIIDEAEAKAYSKEIARLYRQLAKLPA